jgi:hypothetical protein
MVTGIIILVSPSCISICLMSVGVLIPSAVILAIVAVSSSISFL